MFIDPLIDPFALRIDGSRPLTANWDAGAFNITALSFTAGSVILTADQSTIKYGNAGATDDLNLEGKGTVLSRLNLTSSEFVNVFTFGLAAANTGVTSPNNITFGSTNESISFAASTAGKSITFTTPTIKHIGATNLGDGTNDLIVSGTGVVSMTGTAKRALTLRADLDYTKVTALGKPTPAVVGSFTGFSLPIYAADDEELFFNENVPGRWDGVSDILFHVLVCLASAETPDETFKFQFSWNQVGETDVVPAATHDVTDEITVVDGTQYATYMLEFTIDHNIDGGDVVVSHDDLAGRLRRVASSGDEVDGEIIVLDWHTKYGVDKMFKAP